MTTTRDSLGRVRRPTQDAHLGRKVRAGAVSRSHNVNMSAAAHAAFAALSTAERGDLIEAALEGRNK